MKVPNKEEIKEVLKVSNLHAAPGSDGLTNYFYLKCFPIIGDTLVEFSQAIFKYKKLPISQRTCQMVFANKPNKPNSKKLPGKRKINLLNIYSKIITRIKTSHHTKIQSYTTVGQYAVRKYRRIIIE